MFDHKNRIIIIKRITSFVLFNFCFISLSISFSQEVELVISSGYGEGGSVCFSHDNSILATMQTKKIRLWDVKTGREIRTIVYSHNEMHYADTMYFSDDDKTVIVPLSFTNDTYTIEVETGKVEFVKSDKEFDYTKYKYVQTNYLKASAHLISPSTKPIIFDSPDGKTQVVYEKVDNPIKVNANLMPYYYHLVIKQGKNEIPTGDTSYFASFAFSKDSRYLYAYDKIYDLSSTKIISEFFLVLPAGTAVAFLPGTHIPITCGLDNMIVWNFPDVYEIPIKDVGDFYASPGYNYMVCATSGFTGETKEFITIDLANLKNVFVNKSTKISSYIKGVSANAEFYVTWMMNKDPQDPMKVNYSCDLIENKSGKIIKELGSATNVFLLADGKTVLIDSMNVAMKKYDATTGKLQNFPIEGKGMVDYVARLSNSGKYLMGYNITMDEKTYVTNNYVRIWDGQTGKIHFNLKMDGLVTMGYQMSADDQYFVFFNGSDDNSIYVYDLKTRSLIYKLKGHSNYVINMAFSLDNKRLISGSLDGTRRLWNLETGEEIVSLISTGKDDYAIVTPDQYYYCTKGAHKSIYYVKGIKIYPFQQFDLKYNRPDIIARRLLSDNAGLIRSYNLAYKKRLKRMGFTEDMLSGEFHLPETQIVDKNNFPLGTEKADIKIKINASDSKYFLDRLVVKMNDVPIHGKNGIDLTKDKSQTSDTELDLELSAGANNISISVLNEKGVESIADHLDIRYNPLDEQKPDLHLLAMGVGKYSDENFNLNYAAKDANDLYTFYTERKTHFGNIHARFITDEEVTEEAIARFREKLESANVDDVVCIFYAGHGLLDSDLNYYLGAFNIEFEDPSKGGISYDVVEEVMDAIPPRNKFILIDACHSGEIDKEEIMLAAKVEIDENITFRAVPGTSIKQVGLNNSFELMKELFTDIRKSSGTMIISAAGGTEFAMEGDKWSNGVFTYCLLNGLENFDADLNKDSQIMMSEISSFVRKKVKELTNGKQNPTTREEVLNRDWRVW